MIIEHQILDSSTNQVIAKGINRRSGGKLDTMSKFGTAEDAFKFWAGRLQTWLDRLHGQ